MSNIVYKKTHVNGELEYVVTEFTDGQVTAELGEYLSQFYGTYVINERINGYKDLFAIAALKDALDNRYPDLPVILVIPCLFGQRSDRRFGQNKSFDLKLIADFINSMGFDRVAIGHPHSSVALALIEKSHELEPYQYVKMAVEHINTTIQDNDLTLVSPDAGAYKWVYGVAERLNMPLLAANKIRNKDDEPELVFTGNMSTNNYLIVDDLADGGRTFIKLAEALKKKGAMRVFLYVTHGQFNYGFDEIFKSIDAVYCTDSYRDIQNGNVIQFKITKYGKVNGSAVS